MKTGIFGGTFNPPHNGHIRIAEKMTEELGLDRVLIIPNKIPTHKSCDDLADNTDRLEMCRLAFRNPVFEVSDIEIKRDSDSYTIFTVNELAGKYPDDELYLIIGSDMFLMFHKWYRHRELLERCKICVASRNTEDDINAMRSYAFSRLGVFINGRDSRGIHISPIDAYQISSGEIRERIKNGVGVEDAVPPEIIDYMEKRGLYGYRAKQ